MAGLIIFFALFYGFIAYAPEELTKTLLALAWAAMLLSCIGSLIYYGFIALSRSFAA